MPSRAHEGTPLGGRQRSNYESNKSLTWRIASGLAVGIGVLTLLVGWRSIQQADIEAQQAVRLGSPGKPQMLTTVTRTPMSAPRKALWGDIKAPYPTHAFWENFVLGTGVDGNNAVTGLPYILQASESSVDLFYPYTNMATKTQYQLGFDQVVGRLSIGCATYESSIHVVDEYSDLGVTLKHDFGKDGTMKTHVVQGSPYVSYEFDGASPMLTSGQILRAFRVDGKKAACNAKGHTGSLFEFSLLQFDETWRVYAFPPIKLVCTASNPPMALQADDPYTGVLRVALSNNCTYGEAQHHCSGNGHGSYVPSHPNGYGGLLDNHASAMVTGGDVEYSFDGNKANVNFKWRVTSLNKSSVPALMLAMPHSVEMMKDQDSIIDGVAIHRSIHGVQKPVVGNTWEMTETLSDIAYLAPREIKDKDMLKAVKQAAEEDIDWELPWNYQSGTGDPYNAGKMLAKMANIALIADHVGVSKKKIDKFLDNLASGLEVWVNGTSSNALVYDKSWGGVVSCGCKYSYPPPKCLNGGPPNCPALGGDPVSNGFDFGNGAYNDHHFHYGYMIYAAGGLAKLRPSWAKKHAPMVLSLVRDIANPSSDDAYFPKFRHTDWYAGHSWAGGVAMAYLNGRNQESVSEAFNAWYGVSLWGRAINDSEIRDVGRLLAAMEKRGGQTYWQIPKMNSEIYPEEFAEHRTAGIIWSNLIQYQTWFGQLQWEVQGIQTLPVTPASEFLLSKDWTPKAASLFETTCGGSCDTDGWITFLCLLQAITDKSKGWECAMKLDPHVFAGEAAGGNGNSLTNTLYWIATRP
uniref:glucan endo-1,3-beta-D-glucosidase n=1 Tax=Lotharella globosa TaxID=91324 RepID=A0A7S3YX14_9EUKA|mmetsp:Transcript_15072/g.30487  ORF Transcript_15072/g.30487 Transcript_15072/m.30487 type:complete len:802 (-) Transcript_15072:267-2672(-)